jgi:hypothetical protein
MSNTYDIDRIIERSNAAPFPKVGGATKIREGFVEIPRENWLRIKNGEKVQYRRKNDKVKKPVELTAKNGSKFKFRVFMGKIWNKWELDINDLEKIWADPSSIGDDEPAEEESAAPAAESAKKKSELDEGKELLFGPSNNTLQTEINSLSARIMTLERSLGKVIEQLNRLTIAHKIRQNQRQQSRILNSGAQNLAPGRR